MNNIVSRLTTPINTQSVTPNTKGFAPTVFRVLIDSPDPIKNSVTVIPFFESITMKDVNSFGRFKTVFTTMAKMKKKINHGIFIFESFCLKKKVVAIDKGIIHSARVSFTMVATSNALCP